MRVLVIRSKDQANLEDIKKNYDMVVVNYAQLRVCGETLNQIKWLTVILDEGQQIKNPDSKAAKEAREIVSYNRLVLSGTPIENRLRICGPSWPSPCPESSVPAPTSRSALTSARTRKARTAWPRGLKPFLLRRTKSQVAKDLPPKDGRRSVRQNEGIQSQLYKAELRRIQQALLGLDSDESVKKNSFAICRA